MTPEDTIGKYIAYTSILTKDDTGLTGCCLALIDSVQYKGNIKLAENALLITSKIIISSCNDITKYNMPRILYWKSLLLGDIEIYENLSLTKNSIEKFKEQILLDLILCCTPLKRSVMILVNKMLPENERDMELEEILKKDSVKELLFD